MIFVNLADRGEHGIGVVGRNLTRALGELTELVRITPEAVAEQPLPGPLLERFYTSQPTCAATRNVAYIVFENDVQVGASRLRSRCRFDMLAATSKWCEQALRATGLRAVVTIPHGVDSTLFNPRRAGRIRSDRFIIFSGGKFEFRKGQDIVARAFRTFSERHAEAVLVAAWHNPWPDHAATMEGSPYHSFSQGAFGREEDAIRHWLHESGVDLGRVTLVPKLPNSAMAAVYGTTHVGIFPSRCEGATNLLMMEYMACGLPVIATDFAGHRDILTASNSLRLSGGHPLPIMRDGQLIANWCEPDMDEILATLEEVYNDRARLAMVGQQAAATLADWTWHRAAQQFLDLTMT